VGEPNPGAKSVKAGGVSVGRVLLLVVPLALIVFLIFGAYVFGRLPFVDGLFKPALVQAKGVVYWNGELLRGGMIATQSETKGVKGATGMVGTDGTFELETLVDGELKKGAYAGKHKVVVRQNDRTVTMVFSQPPSSSPEKYLDFATSDLLVDVQRDASKNNFRLEMTGTGPKGQNNSKEEREKYEAEQAAKAKQPKVNPAELAKKLIEDNDADKDGKLSESERGGIPFQYQRGLSYADLNKDGFLDEKELEDMVTPK